MEREGFSQQPRETSPSTIPAISAATRQGRRAARAARRGSARNIEGARAQSRQPLLLRSWRRAVVPDKEEEPGSRISDVRFKQLQATGANTVVTACPFCSIMLKGAQASAGADTQFVDLMTFVNGKSAGRASS